jgi:hypothetical protein
LAVNALPLQPFVALDISTGAWDDDLVNHYLCTIAV